MGNSYNPIEGKKKRPFEVLRKCQTLDAMVCNATVKAEKGHRFTLVKYTQELCHELVHTTRRANAMEKGSDLRLNEMLQGVELCEKIIDMLPILRDTRCISVGEMGEIDKFVSSIKYSYNSWVKSTS